MNVIEMRSVGKRYGATEVLHDLDLDIRAGEVFALLGPNGAGKTTAVEILEGYRRADRGSVSVLGADPSTAGAGFRARIGIVLQQTTAFERSTVRETVEMFAALYPRAMSAGEAIDLVGLGPQADAIADTMSGGQRRRLDVACGLVGRPEVLFLDEPTTGLDPEARRAMWAIVGDLRASGTTVLLTTHYLDEAEALADRVGILLDGQLVDVAEPHRVAGVDRAPAVVRFVVPSGADEDDRAGWQVEDDRVSIETDRPDAVVADLVARFGQIAKLTVSRPSLEDVYLSVVAGAEVSS